MKLEKIVDEILNNYLKNGSDKRTLIEIRSKIINMLIQSKDKTPSEIIIPALNSIKEATIDFLTSKNLKGIDILSGISSSIYISDTNEYNIYIYSGLVDPTESYEIDENTLFDVDSITKLYTLILKDKLIEMGYFSDDTDISSMLGFGEFKNLTIEYLSRMSGEVRTNGKIEEAKTYEEALEILKTSYLFNSGKSNNTDIFGILIAIAITNIYNKVNSTNLKYENILENLILKPYNLNDTCYNPTLDRITTGCGNIANMAFDPKARILNGVTGSSGIFTSSKDLVKLSKYMFNSSLVGRENLEKYSKIIFPNSENSNKGYFGLDVKNNEYNKSFASRNYSNSVFAIEGYTGSLAIFDPLNKFHNGILVNAVRPDLEKELQNNPLKSEYIIDSKANGYKESLHTYNDVLTKNTLIIDAIKKYLDLYDKDNNTVNTKIKIR